MTSRSPRATRRRPRAGLLASATLALSTTLAGSLAATAMPAHAAPVTATASVSAQQVARSVTPAQMAHATELAHRLGVIDPTKYKCGAQPDVDAWFARQEAVLTSDDKDFLGLTLADQLPTYEAMLFGGAGDPDFPVPGSAVAQKTFHRLQGFWSPQLSDVQLMGMDGRMLTSHERVARTAAIVFGMDATQASAYADVVVGWITTHAEFQGGAWPLFTFQAFATSTASDPLIPSNRIVLGAGVMQAYQDLGYGDVAEQFILAHEFGHTVQMAAHAYDSVPDTPEGTMYMELMADSLSAYFNSHPQGNNMHIKRIARFAVVAYDVGDCSFTSPSHHGTPDQRLRAAALGAGLQYLNNWPHPRVLPFAQFKKEFDKAYPVITAPDAN